MGSKFFVITTLLIFFLLNTSLLLYYDYSITEVPYFEFNSHMMDPFFGTYDLPIKLTYVPQKDTVILYYQSTYFLIAVILFSEEREKFINYLNKYITWREKVIKRKITLKKHIGDFKAVVFFKYVNQWYNGGEVVGYTFFYSVHKYIHHFVVRFSKTHAQINPSLIFEPEPLYFNLADIKQLKKALDSKFIQSQNKKTKEVKPEFIDDFE